MQQHNPTTEMFATSEHADPSKAVFIWLIFIMMSLASIIFTMKSGSSIPYGDDWAHIQHFAGGMPKEIGWYFSGTNSHRLPLTKLMMAANWSSTSSVQIGLTLNILTFATCTFFATKLILSGGRPVIYSCAFIPMAMMQMGNGWNYLWWVQSFFLLAGGLASVLIVSLFNSNAYRTKHTRVILLVCLVLLSWQGSAGAIFSAVLGIGVLVATRRYAKDSSPFWSAGIAVFASCIPLTLVIYERLANGSSNTQFIPTAMVLKSILSFLACGFGSLGMRAGFPAGLTLLVTFTISIFLVRERWNQFNCIISLLACLGVATAISINRESGGALRYVIFAVPFTVGLFCSLRECRYPKIAELMCMFLFTGVTAIQLYDASFFWQIGKDRRQQEQMMLRDLEGGTPPSFLAAKYGSFWGNTSDQFKIGINTLRAVGVDPYNRLAEEPVWKPETGTIEQPNNNGWSFLTPSNKLSEPTALKISFEVVSDEGHDLMEVELDNGTVNDPYARISKFSYTVKPRTGRQLKEQLIISNQPIRSARVRMRSGAEITVHRVEFLKS